MRQVALIDGSIKLLDVPAPTAPSKGVLVATAYSLISTGTEVSIVEETNVSLLEKVKARPQRAAKAASFLIKHGLNATLSKLENEQKSFLLLGYSLAGVVVAVGKEETQFNVGDFVACAGAGVANHAEYVAVPENLVVRIPQNCTVHDAASVAVGSVAMQGIRRAALSLGDVVAVIGLGLLGQLTVQMLKANGCQVIGLDLDPRRIALAKNMGADFGFNSADPEVINEINRLTQGYGVDAAIITAASRSNSIVHQAALITRRKGKIVLVGSVGLGLQRSPLYEKEIDFLISTSYGPGRYDPQYEKKSQDYPYAYVRWTENRNMSEYLRIIASGKINLAPILEYEFRMDEAAAAYSILRDADKKPLGVILKYPAAGRETLVQTPQTKIQLRQNHSNGKINVAVIGAGNFAKYMHIPNLQKLSDRYHIHAVVDPVGSNASKIAEQFGAEIASTNYDDVLSDDSVDMVLICTRHKTHADMAIRAARAGKAILLEKPMALNYEELDGLVSVLEETKVPFMVGFNRRFSPAARKIKELITARQNPIMMLYRVNAGYMPPNHWMQGEEGGGRVIGEACHMFDLFQYFVSPAKVLDIQSEHINPNTQTVSSNDNVNAVLKYEDGSVANLFYTALGHPALPKEYIEIYEDGKVYLLDDFNSLKISGTSQKGWESKIQDKGHLDELIAFSRFLRGEMDAPIPLECLIETTRVSFKVAGLKEPEHGVESGFEPVYLEQQGIRS